MKTSQLTFILVGSFLFLFSCSSPDYSSAIIGDWETVKIDNKAPKTVSCVTIKADGTARFYYLDEKLTKWDDEQGKGSGTWELDGDVLQINRDKMKAAAYSVKKVTDTEMVMFSRGRFKLKIEYKKRK